MKRANPLAAIGTTEESLYLTEAEQRAIIDQFRRLMDDPQGLDNVEFLVEEAGGDSTKAYLRERVTGRPEGVDFGTACKRANIDYYRFTITRRAKRRELGDFGFVCDSLEEEYRELAGGRLRVLGLTRNNITALKHTAKHDAMRIDHHFHPPAAAPGTVRVDAQGEPIPQVSEQTQARIASIPSPDVIELESRAAALLGEAAINHKEAT